MVEEKKELEKESRRLIPPVDIYETKDDVMLIADIPGVSKEDLNLDISDGELTIRGSFKDENGGGRKLMDECLYGEYYRTFALGNTIDRDKISAKLEKGVLTLTLPKQEQVKPRRIAIEA